MDTGIPSYVLKANEANTVISRDPSWKFTATKVILWTVEAFVIKFLVEVTILPWWIALLIILFIVIKSMPKKISQRVPSPFEIRFYDDYLVIYREKRYYSKKVSRMEYFKFFYKDIHKVRYATKSHKLVIYGIVEGIFYKYNKDDTLPDEPAYHKTTDSMFYFYTDLDPDINFIQELEEHSPVKVIFDDSVI